MGEVRHLRQPRGSDICGQTCMAMLTGKTIEESLNIYGHSKATYMTEHVDILRKLGYKAIPVMRVDNRKKYELPPVAIVRIHKNGRKNGHLVLHYKGKIYDSERSFIFNSKEEMINWYSERDGIKWRISSYVMIDESSDLVAGE